MGGEVCYSFLPFLGDGQLKRFDTRGDPPGMSHGKWGLNFQIHTDCGLTIEFNRVIFKAAEVSKDITQKFHMPSSVVFHTEGTVGHKSMEIDCHKIRQQRAFPLNAFITSVNLQMKTIQDKRLRLFDLRKV